MRMTPIDDVTNEENFVLWLEALCSVTYTNIVLLLLVFLLRSGV
jgi:hypothetical protein